MNKISYETGMILTEIETALAISSEDYNSRDIVSVVRKVKDKLSRQYNIDFNSDNLDTVYSGTVTCNEAKLFLDVCSHIHSRLSGLGNYYRFIGSINVDLNKINYLGFTKDSLKTFLVILQKKGTEDRAREMMARVADKLSTISICTEKRLVLLLVVTYNLELYELTAVIAEILYLGGI